MKFKMTVRQPNGGDTWVESYVRDCEDAEAEAREIVNRFNATLRPGELPREVVAVEVVGDTLPHVWVKLTAQMSVIRKEGGTFDGYYCSRCGITGYRLNLNAEVARDRAYRAKRYTYCSNNG